MLQQPAAPSSWRLDRERVAVHDYFGAAVAETRHALTDAAQAACMADPELSPGLDCCAVCARAAPPLRPKPKAGKAKAAGKGGEDGAAQLLECKGCHRVVYCCREHQLEDKPSHSPVCQLLAMIQSTDAVEVTPQRQGELIDLFPRSCQELPPSLKDWCGVVPSHFAQVWRRRKKSEKQQAAAGGTAQAKAGSSSSTAPAAASSSPDTFPLVAELAVASSLLSYPLTLLACLGAGASPQRQPAAGGTPAAPGPAGGLGLRWAVPVSRPLVVCVLGASEAAELAQPQVWQVLDGLHPGGVHLQFVGPEVPEAMHATTMQAGPSKGVTMTFFQGEYDRLAHQVLSAVGSSGGGPDAAGTAKVKGAEGKRAAGAKPRSSALPLPPALLLLPDVVLGFNMGLTCPDYNWLPTLKALKRISGARRSGGPPASSGPPPPLRLVATCNTFVEAAMEDEVLREDGGFSVERAVRANPFVCLELMQSGTLGNDVYRKNAWVACYELQAKPSVRELGKATGAKPKGGSGAAGGGKKRSAQEGPGAKGGARAGAGGDGGRKKRKL